MRKNEQGTILVEFVGSFLLFVLLIISILSLVNISTMQARMHYALTQSANTLSMYGYVLNVIGVDEFLIQSNARANEVREGTNSAITDTNAVLSDINDVFNHLNSSDIRGLAGSTQNLADNTQTAANNIGDQANNILENPVEAVQYLANYALGELGSAGFEQILRPLVAYHLTNGDMSGEEYLWSVGVSGMDGLEFHRWSSAIPGYTPASEGEIVGTLNTIPDDNSILLNGDGNVKITVQYEMSYDFMGLNKLLPFDEPKLKITQSVMTKMWLGGRGEGYVKVQE